MGKIFFRIAERHARKAFVAFEINFIAVSRTNFESNATVRTEMLSGSCWPYPLAVSLRACVVDLPIAIASFNS
jgi:hypothetical protein